VSEAAAEEEAVSEAAAEEEAVPEAAAEEEAVSEAAAEEAEACLCVRMFTVCTILEPLLVCR
jgi:hypothetical protein